MLFVQKSCDSRNNEKIVVTYVPVEVESIVSQERQRELQTRKYEQIEKIYHWYSPHSLKLW